MSNYNWERGTIKIPSKAWKPLRDKLVDAANKRRAALLAQALRIHACLSDRANINAAREAVKAWNKRQPVKDRRKLATVTPHFVFEAVNSDWREGLSAEIRRLPCLREVKLDKERIGTGWEREMAVPYDVSHAIEAMLFPFDQKTRKRKRLAKPKKSDPSVKTLVRTKVKSIGTSDATLYFDHEAKTLTWDVDENNRAVERAGESWLARLLFPALNRIEWTRGSGGKIVGNDEYNRDDRSEWGGGNYVTREFGPEVSKRRKVQDRAFARNW